jgi:hypothetical protein
MAGIIAYILRHPTDSKAVSRDGESQCGQHENHSNDASEIYSSMAACKESDIDCETTVDSTERHRVLTKFILVDDITRETDTLLVTNTQRNKYKRALSLLSLVSLWVLLVTLFFSPSFLSGNILSTSGASSGSENDAVSLFQPLMAILATVVLISVSGDGPASWFLATRGAVWLGDLSYVLYLVHWPTIVFARYALFLYKFNILQVFENHLY